MKANRVVPRKLKGFQDITPEKMRIRSKIERALQEEANLAGFHEVSTPALEYAEVLLGVGGETDKQVFRFQDNGKRDVALRFDLTVPFARFIAEHQGDLTFPFKRLQIANVWRAEKPQKGRYREFAQADIDIIGTATPAADIEVILCFAKALDKVLPQPFTIQIGHRQLLSLMLRKFLGELDSAAENFLLINLDKIDKLGSQTVAEIITKSEFQFPKDQVSELIAALIGQENQNSTTLARLRELLNDESSAQVIDHLDSVISSLEDLLESSKAKIQLKMATVRGLGYYSGTVFETTVDGFEEFGSIASGGRYDRLAERFTQRAYPGMGGSIGVDRLVALLEDLQKKTDATPELTDRCMLAYSSPEMRLHGLKLATRLRSLGQICEIALTENKLGQQLKLAHRSGCRHAIIIGDSEVKSGTHTIKDLSTGKQRQELSFEELIECLRN